MRFASPLGILAMAVCIATVPGCRPRHAGPVPAGYAASYARRIARADREGELEIWAAIDRRKAATLVADFSRAYPGIRVRYIEMPSDVLFRRFSAAAATGRGTADFLWSSAMDLMIKLANDGYARRYRSPERGNLPGWANWKDQAWGTTAEPITFLYNRGLVPDPSALRGHDTLLGLLESRPRWLRGRFATYDVGSSAVGYLYLSQDAGAVRNPWRFVRAMAANDARFFANAESMVHAIAAGHVAIGYDIVGSYALAEAARDPAIGVVVPRDYTLLMSRIALIPAASRHPAAAELFLDFLLSRRGQRHLVAQNMPSVRRDIAEPPRLSTAGAPLRAIRVGPALLVDEDRLTRRYFLARWRAAIADGRADASGK